MLFFDLQLFAEDSNTEGTSNDTATNEDVASKTVDNDGTEQKEEIPAELAGLPENIARETMAEAANAASEADSDNDAENVADSVDADNDNKQYQQPNLDNQRIPYNRFKQELDKKKELEERNKELERQLKALQQSQTQPQPQQPLAPNGNINVATQTQQQRQQPAFNADVVGKINAAAKEQAMQMTGLTQDDLDAFEYMEEDDPRKQSWKTAYEMARVNVFAGIQQARNIQQREAQRLMAIHQASVEDYNNFAQQEMNSPDFKNIVDYATNSYFETGIAKAEQPAIAAAYSRIERNVASPGDIALIKRYFTDAKNAYYRENPKSTPPRRNSVASKVKQAQSFPRSQNVTGAADIDAPISEATLEKMLNERNWEDIPKEYQDILLGKS